MDLGSVRYRGCLTISPFQPVDRCFQPFDDRRLQFFLRSCPVKRVNRLSILAQRNITARHLPRLLVLRNELHEDAIAARLPRLSGIKLQASRRILKHEVRTPRGSCAVTISAFLDKLQFRPKNLEQASFVVRHKRNLFPVTGSLGGESSAVTGITLPSASYHEGRTPLLEHQKSRRHDFVRTPNGTLLPSATYNIIRVSHLIAACK